jgi:hypothetical protein
MHPLRSNSRDISDQRSDIRKKEGKAPFGAFFVERRMPWWKWFARTFIWDRRCGCGPPQKDGPYKRRKTQDGDVKPPLQV